MRDLTNARAIWTKAILFLVIGLVSGGLVFLESPTLKTATYLLLMIWAFCRAYYFAFYVIEHYVDPTFKFSGLGSFIRYMLRRPDPKP